MLLLGAMLFRCHSECRCGSDGAESSFSEMYSLVVFRVAQLEDLVGGKGRGG